MRQARERGGHQARDEVRATLVLQVTFLDLVNKKSIFLCSFSDPYSLNPDPVKNLNLDPDPSFFFPLSGMKEKINLLHYYKIFSSKEVNASIER